MKRLLISASALTMLAGTAAAADLPSYEAVPEAAVVAPVSTWTGFYAGLHAGYGWADSDFDVTDVSDTVLDAAEVPDVPGAEEAFLDGLNDEFGLDPDLDGFVAGGQIGFNWQISNFVLGVEGDASWSGIDGSESYDFDEDIDASFDTEVEWLASVRARAGFAFDRFMVYGTGGVAWAGVNAEIGATDEGEEFDESFDDSDTQMGWVAGVGIEGKVTEMVSVRAEYLHYDLGEGDFEIEGEDLTETTFGVDLENDLQVDVVRIGMNVLFNGM